jgi:hypothetical protein
MNKSLANALLGLPDEDLALIVNRWGMYKFVVTGDETAVETKEGENIPLPELRKWEENHYTGAVAGFYLAWSALQPTQEFLTELDVKQVGCVASGGDGGYIYTYTSPDKTFKFDGNVYDFKCFVPAARWALEEYIQRQN